MSISEISNRRNYQKEKMSYSRKLTETLFRARYCKVSAPDQVTVGRVTIDKPDLPSKLDRAPIEGLRLVESHVIEMCNADRELWDQNATLIEEVATLPGQELPIYMYEGIVLCDHLVESACMPLASLLTTAYLRPCNYVVIGDKQILAIRGSASDSYVAVRTHKRERSYAQLCTVASGASALHDDRDIAVYDHEFNADLLSMLMGGEEVTGEIDGHHQSVGFVLMNVFDYELKRVTQYKFSRYTEASQVQHLTTHSDLNIIEDVNSYVPLYDDEGGLERVICSTFNAKTKKQGMSFMVDANGSILPERFTPTLRDGATLDVEHEEYTLSNEAYSNYEACRRKGNMKDVQRLCRDHIRARRMDAISVPRPRQDEWYTDDLISQFGMPNIAPGYARTRDQSEISPIRPIKQFRVTTNAGVDIQNRKSVLLRANDANVAKEMSSKIFSRKVGNSFLVQRALTIFCRSQWLVVKDNNITLHTNSQSDITVEALISFDSHIRPTNLIIHVKPIEKYDAALSVIDVYPIRSDYDNTGLSYLIEYASDDVEMLGNRTHSCPLIDHLAKQIGLDVLEISRACQTCVSHTRAHASEHIRRYYRAMPNSRIMAELSDDGLLEKLLLVPNDNVARKIRHEIPITVNRNIFSNIAYQVSHAYYTDRNSLLSGFSPLLLDSIGVRINRKVKGVDALKVLPSECAREWCSSYNYRCTSLDAEARGMMKYRNDGMLILPCGYITTTHHRRLNIHSCMRHHQSLPDSKDVTIHGSYRCQGCDSQYTNNLSAQICKIFCEHESK